MRTATPALSTWLLIWNPETKFVFALVTNGCNVNAKDDHICTLSRKLFEMMWGAYAQ